ncbi:hypothetical protein Trydic_g16112 [Trypoxylus dichotomus]
MRCFLVYVGATSKSVRFTDHSGRVEGKFSSGPRFQWCKGFLEGQDSIKDELCGGKLSTARGNENVHRIQEVIRFDQMTVRMIRKEDQENLSKNDLIKSDAIAWKDVLRFGGEFKMLLIFYSEGVIHFELVSEGRALKYELCYEQLE